MSGKNCFTKSCAEFPQIPTIPTKIKIVPNNLKSSVLTIITASHPRTHITIPATISTIPINIFIFLRHPLILIPKQVIFSKNQLISEIYSIKTIKIHQRVMKTKITILLLSNHTKTVHIVQAKYINHRPKANSFRYSQTLFQNEKEDLSPCI